MVQEYRKVWTAKVIMPLFLSFTKKCISDTWLEKADFRTKVMAKFICHFLPASTDFLIIMWVLSCLSPWRLIYSSFEETKGFLPVAGSCPRLMNPLAVTSLSQSSALPPCFLLLSHSVSFPLFPPYFPCSPLLSRLPIGLFPLFLLKVNNSVSQPRLQGKCLKIKSKHPSLNTDACKWGVWRNTVLVGQGGDQCRKRGVRILSSTILYPITWILGILHQNHVLFI